MMRNPDPSDWLMIRHDYHANNYSPLNQITAQNVKELQLAWVWAMNEGTNQPAPVVHNGIMFINNPGNIVQALDARTGELIWENRIGESGHRQLAARPGDLRGQGLRHHQRRAHLRARCAHRKERLGHRDRRPQVRQLQHQQRAACWSRAK